MPRSTFEPGRMALRCLACCAILSAVAAQGLAQDDSGSLPAEKLTGSVGREAQNAAADVLTIQVALNQVPARQGGAFEEMLVPDATVGPATIAAIERFQSRQFDGAVNGNVGGRISAGRVDPKGPTLARLNELLAAQSLQDRIVQVARGEELFWQNGQRTETDAAVAKRLKNYWAAVGQDFREDQLRSVEFQSKWPWSAAFVSWVMKRAGAGDRFRYSAAHRVYTSAAKQNRLEQNDNPFKAYRVEEVSPQVGGVIVNGRGGSTVDYDNVDNGQSHKTHGDIVVRINDNTVVVIGGNVSNSVRTTTVQLDDDCHLKPKAYFAVIVIDEE